ncbi:MAG: GNAT family protein [Bacteroidales bacterium]
MPLPQLESSLIRLRALEPEDIDILYAWENNPTIWRVSNTIAPFSKYTLQQFIENAHRDIFEVKQMRLMIEARLKDNYRPVGTIELFDFDPYHFRAGIGVLIADPLERRKGYASDAIEIFTRYAFQILGLHQVYCSIETTNLPSIALFRKAGFEEIGIKKDWLRTPEGWFDEVFMQLINPR